MFLCVRETSYFSPSKFLLNNQPVSHSVHIGTGRLTLMQPHALDCKERGFQAISGGPAQYSLGIVSAVVRTVRVWNSIQQQKFGCEKCSSKAVHLSFIFSIPKRYHRALSIMNKMNSLAPTVPYSLQIYAASKQPCAANKSFPIGEVTPFNFKNCAELNNLFLFNIWGIERFNIKKKTNTKISTAGQFRSR